MMAWLVQFGQEADRCQAWQDGQKMMSTDWQLVRAMMESAISACERFEAAGITPGDRERLGEANGRSASVFDALTSAWNYPETLRYRIIRQRHAAGADQPYVPEAARILVHVAQACAELIGAGKLPQVEAECRDMVRWYGEHAVPLVESALRKPD
jgi:hypothetical protein